MLLIVAHPIVTQLADLGSVLRHANPADAAGFLHWLDGPAHVAVTGSMHVPAA